MKGILVLIYYSGRTRLNLCIAQGLHAIKIGFYTRFEKKITTQNIHTVAPLRRPATATYHPLRIILAIGRCSHRNHYFDPWLVQSYSPICTAFSYISYEIICSYGIPLSFNCLQINYLGMVSKAFSKRPYVDFAYLHLSFPWVISIENSFCIRLPPHIPTMVPSWFMSLLNYFFLIMHWVSTICLE